MLSPYRVLDLTTERGLLCGQILGDLGADVIKIEPPGGAPARRIGPFYGDIPGPDGSLFWWSYNRNKRSITLDITRRGCIGPAGRGPGHAAGPCGRPRQGGCAARAPRRLPSRRSGPLGWRSLWATTPNGRGSAGSSHVPNSGTTGVFPPLRSALTHRGTLDTILAAWTQEHDAQEAAVALQARGVPASAVQNSQELSRDPQLLQRGHFVQLPHPLHGTTTIEGSRFTLSRTPARVERAAPTLGRDHQYVLETILGYSPERIAALTAANVLR